MTDAVSIRQDILSKKVTATQVAERFLSRIDAIDPKVRAFLSLNKPAALAATKTATLPHADFDAYYQPKNRPAPELLDPSGK